MHRHFVTGSFKSHATHLSDEDYGILLDTVAIACVDIVVLNQYDEMLLGKRTREPQPDWWIIGGRMIPGESFEQAAARNLLRELGLDIEPNRFHYLDTFSLVWSKRTQPPQNNGCHTISITMFVTLTDREITTITPNDEYSELKWRSLRDIVTSDLHTMVISCAQTRIAHLANPIG